jgi:hypothetical protein
LRSLQLGSRRSVAVALVGGHRPPHRSGLRLRVQSGRKYGAVSEQVRLVKRPASSAPARRLSRGGRRAAPVTLPTPQAVAARVRRRWGLTETSRLVHAAERSFPGRDETRRSRSFGAIRHGTRQDGGAGPNLFFSFPFAATTHRTVLDRLLASGPAARIQHEGRARRICGRSSARSGGQCQIS